MNIEDGDFKIGLLKAFWDSRDRNLIPPNEKGIGIKKQKFMVLYNLIAKSLGEPYTLKNLKAFEQGPVFYDVFAHIKNTGEYLEQKSIKTTRYSDNILNATLNLVELESDKSLSDITHALDLWKNNYDENYDEKIIRNDFKYDNNNISAEDITKKDTRILKVLFEYHSNLYNNYDVEVIHGKRCAIQREKKTEIKKILLNTNNPHINDIFDELKQVDNAAKINYDERFVDEKLGGVLIDI